MKRRIELTRERWTRMSIPNAATSCPHNGPRREVMTVLQAARRVGIPAGMLNDAIGQGRIAVWQGPGEALVCLPCVRDLVVDTEK